MAELYWIFPNQNLTLLSVDQKQLHTNSKASSKREQAFELLISRQTIELEIKDL
jgi:hypothetical protein